MAKKKKEPTKIKRWIVKVHLVTDDVDEKTACEILDKMIGSKPNVEVHSANEVRAALIENDGTIYLLDKKDE